MSTEQKRRNDAIERAVLAGMSHAYIGEVLGMSKDAVAQVLARRKRHKLARLLKLVEAAEQLRDDSAKDWLKTMPAHKRWHISADKLPIPPDDDIDEALEAAAQDVYGSDDDA